jgi:HEAT repeat protein
MKIVLWFGGFSGFPWAATVRLFSTNPRNESRTLPIVFAGLCIAACAGCRVFVEGLGSWRGPAGDERWVNSAKPLGADLWRPNPAWSPLNELDEVPISDPEVCLWRWTHPQFQAALKLAEGQGLISAPIRRDAEAAAAGQRIGPTDTLLNAWFSNLARTDDLVGWNAAILWSHYDPSAASETVGVLSRLVERPPRYQPEEPLTIRAQNGAQESAPAASGKNQPAKSGRSIARIEISMNMRLAAADAWCRVLGASREDPESALAPAGRALQSGKLPTKVEDELLRGIARRVRPDRIPGLSRALESNDQESPRAIESRRAAVDACVIHAVQRRVRGELSRAGAAGDFKQRGDDAESLAAGDEEGAPWPTAFWRFSNAQDPKLRKRVGELAAVIRHPAAISFLKSQLNDIDVLVVEAAIFNMGVLGTDEAMAELGAQAKRGEERRRELAVRGLACRGPQTLAPFTSDKSARVRVEVARLVRRRPGAAAARVLSDLLADASLEVQTACVRSVRNWPESLATPLLLEILASSAFRARKAALQQLEDRRGGGLAFPLLAGPQERALRVQQWSRDWNIPDAAVERVNELTRAGSPLLDQARLADFRERLQTADHAGESDTIARIADWAAELTPEDLPLAERLLEEADPLQSDLLLHHVLPRLSTVYGALAQLENPDATVRRQAASRIGHQGQEASLSPAVCCRLHDLMKTEQDNLVWRLAMLGVYRDGSEEAARLALLAINHHWPDVRILGCEYVGRHEVPEQALWVLPLIYDSNKAVQLAAVTAAGKCRNPILLDGMPSAPNQASLRGLRPLLTESQGQIQFAVVASMARLGDAEAMQELIRLAMDVNSTSRLEVVQTMGDTSQTRFIEPLIRLAWTEPNHHVRQAALASLQKLVPPAAQPAGLIRAKSAAEAVEIWAGWWEDRLAQRARG